MNKTVKRIILTLLTAAFVFSCFSVLSVSTFSAVVESGPYGENVTYTIYSDGRAVISGVGEMEDHGYVVNSPFDGNKEIKSAVIENGITNIASNLFYGCSGLERVDIPSSVGYIGQFAFSGCKSLKRINIPSGVTKIETDVFEGCSGLEEITVDSGNSVFYTSSACLIERAAKSLIRGCSTSVIPTDGSVTEIAIGAFDGCSGLKSITIPDAVKKIGDFAFFGCSSLMRINIPAGVVDIGEIVFGECPSLAEITVDERNTRYHSAGNCLIFRTATYRPTRILDNWPFVDSEDICAEKRIIIAGCSASVIPSDSGVTGIGRGAFWGCTGLKEIHLPDTVKNIHESAFNDCSGLKSIELPPSVTYIGSNAFSGCSALTDANIPGGVTYVGYYAFAHCAALKRVDIAVGETDFGDNVFYECYALTDIYFSGNREQWTGYRFRGCEDLLRLVKVHFAVSDHGYVLIGDISGDDEILANDARLALRASARLEDLSEAQMTAADVDGSGEVQADDARQILRYSAKLQQEFEMV